MGDADLMEVAREIVAKVYTYALSLDRAGILHRESERLVAAALQAQRQRAEAAEAELAELRERVEFYIEQKDSESVRNDRFTSWLRHLDVSAVDITIREIFLSVLDQAFDQENDALRALLQEGGEHG